MKKKEIIKHLSINDLESFLDMKTIAESQEVVNISGKEITGFEALSWFLANYDGGRIYIPKLSSIEDVLLKYLKENKRQTVRNLAYDLGISETKTRELLKKI